MKHRLSISIAIALVLTAGNLGIGNNHQQNATLAVAQPNSNCDSLGPLIRIEGGEVKIRRRGNSNYQLAKVGDVLCRGDRIQLGKTARAIIRCNINNQEGLYPSGRESGAASPCPPVSLCNVSSCNREPNPIISAEIISPRNTALLINKPSFIWRAVPGATNYIVVLKKRSGEEVWKKEVSTTQMNYPADQPSLTPGITYELTVTPSPINNAESAESELTVLNEKDAQDVRDYVSQSELDKAVEIPSRVSLYIDYKLRDEAIKTLEGLVKQGKESAAIYLKLGDLYWLVKLPDLAKNYYLTSVELAKAAGNLQGQKLAQDRLDELNQSIGTLENYEMK